MMISEYVIQGNMQTRLEHFEWDLDKGTECLRGVAEGMAYLHSFNVLHGDLKTVNVMIGEFGTLF